MSPLADNANFRRGERLRWTGFNAHPGGYECLDVRRRNAITSPGGFSLRSRALQKSISNIEICGEGARGIQGGLMTVMLATPSFPSAPGV